MGHQRGDLSRSRTSGWLVSEKRMCTRTCVEVLIGSTPALDSVAHSTKPTPLTTLNEDDIETTLCMATCLLLTVRAANFLSLMSRKHAWNRCLMEWKWLHCNHSPRPQNREPGSMRKKGNERRGGLISSGRAYWGPTCRQQFNTRPCADPAPGYEL